MPDVLAIVSRSVFERDAFVGRSLAGLGDVWPVDRYISTHKSFTPLREGGRIFLVTVRPPDEELWLVGVLDAPLFDDGAWIGRAPNSRPVTNITALRRTIVFASGKGLSQEQGTLGMSLQTPRVLTPGSAAEILAVVGGAQPRAANAPPLADEVASREEETPALKAERTQREAALEGEVARFVVLFDKMQETYGLRLPESLAYAAGFIMGLRPEERAEVERSAGRLIGVGAWFGGSELARAPGGDERLRDRLPDDPPELVPVLASTTHGDRWGLWYDDSDELPAGVAVRSSSTEAPGVVTSVTHASLLATLRGAIVKGGGPHLTAILGWLDDVLRHEARNVRERTTVPAQREVGWILGERMNPYVPGWLPPLDLMGNQAQRLRAAAYLADDPIVQEWIERARSELRDGAPGRALFLGRELHAFQAPRWRLACSELLIRAYAALGRQPLADIVRASGLHFAPAQPIYELPAAHPVSAAAARGDLDEIALALKEGVGPTADELEESLASAETLEALDVLLDHDASHTDVALWRRLQKIFRASGGDRALRGKAKEQLARDRALALRLMERGTVSARAFERILRSGDVELSEAAAARVGLASMTPAGATPLHVAAGAPAPEAVRVLLDRGADPRAKNAAGRMSFDCARELQIESPNDARASEILALLQKAGGGIAKPPLPASDEIEYAEGDAVHHRKLGDGIVESVSGEGEEAKLKIRFETETRTLLAKFVTPRATDA